MAGARVREPPGLGRRGERTRAGSASGSELKEAHSSGLGLLCSCLIGSRAPCARHPVHLNEGFSKTGFFSLGLE